MLCLLWGRSRIVVRSLKDLRPVIGMSDRLMSDRLMSDRLMSDPSQMLLEHRAMLKALTPLAEAARNVAQRQFALLMN